MLVQSIREAASATIIYAEGDKKMNFVSRRRVEVR
jgi:hypothetical protein